MKFHTRYVYRIAPMNENPSKLLDDPLDVLTQNSLSLDEITSINRNREYAVNH